MTTTITRPSVPTAPGAVPLLGHAWPMLRNPLRFLEDLPAQGRLVRIRLANMPAVVVCDPELTREVTMDLRTFDIGGPIFDRARQEVFGKSIGTVVRDQYLQDRRELQPAFVPGRMPGYAEQMTEHINAMVGSWHDGQVLDVFAQTQSLAGRSLVSCMLSGAFSAQARAQVEDDIGTILSGIYRRTLLPPALNRLPTPANRRYQEAGRRLRQMARDAIAARRASGRDHGDLLSAMIAAYEPTGCPMARGGAGEAEDARLVDHFLAVATGGIETVASSLAWSLHLVAAHPDIERQLHEEVDRVLAGGPARPEHLPDLPLAARVVTEAIRVWPPVWLMSRMTTTDTELGGHPIAAGTSVFFSQYIIHHLPDLWPDPYRFDPDRWLPERAKAIPRGAYIPFTDGVRKCIGYQFGLTEITLGLAAIVARWRLGHTPDGRPRPTARVSLRPGGLRLKIADRT